MVFTRTALKGWREPHISNCSFVTGKEKMTSRLYTLLFLGLICVGLATAKTKEQVRVEQLDLKLANVETELKACIDTKCTVDEQLERLEILLELIRDDIYDLRVDQELMKKDLVSRLEAIEDTLKENLPMVQTARIEHILANHYRDFRPSINFTDANLPKGKFLIHASCEAAFNAGWTKSGVYRVSPEGSGVVIDVYCEQESELFGGGWTVFQRRLNGNVDFYRTWDQYKNGFGDINGEFWLGNDNIHLLTADHNQMLKVELELHGSGFAYADYAAFRVNNETQKYQLHVSGFSAGDPNPGDSLLSKHNGMFFTTKDMDNDQKSTNCAQEFKGAWWYRSCYDSNLNGLYGPANNRGITWYHWKGYTVPLTSVRMMMKANPSLLADGEVDTN